MTGFHNIHALDLDPFYYFFLAHGNLSIHYTTSYSVITAFSMTPDHPDHINMKLFDQLSMHY